MTTPTGTIGMSDVNVELGFSSTATITLNDTAVRYLAGIPSGTISLNDLRGKSAGSSYVAVAHATSPRISVYAWSNSGFGTKFSNPGSLPTGTTYSVSTNAGPYTSTPSTVIAVYSGAGSPYAFVYPWSSSGFGTKYADPSGWPVASGSIQNNSMCFSPNGANIVFGLSSNSPYITAYPFSGGFGSRYANPATLPNSYVSLLNWSRTGGTVFVTGNQPGGSAKYAPTYAFSGGFGALDPGPTLSGLSFGFCQHPTQDYVVIGISSSTASVRGFNWTEGTGFGAAITNPTTSAAGSARCTSFTRGGDTLGMSGGSSPYIHAYQWGTGAFGSKYANPAVIPGASSAMGFSWSGLTATSCAVVSSTSPYIYAYPFSGGFGTLYANPGTAVAGSGEAVTFFG